MSKVCLSLEWFFGNIIVIFKFVWILKRLDKNLWERAVMLAPYLRMLILVLWKQLLHTTYYQLYRKTTFNDHEKLDLC